MKTYKWQTVRLHYIVKGDFKKFCNFKKGNRDRKSINYTNKLKIKKVQK